MTRRTLRDLARRQATATAATPGSTAAQPPTDLGSVAAQVPGLQRLLEQRQQLESRMQALGAAGAGAPAPGDNRYPVASLAERKAELERWTRQHEQLRPRDNPMTALDQRPRQAPANTWQQLRDNQNGQALARARNQLGEQQALMQRLDQRISQARNKSLEKIRDSREQSLLSGLQKPLRDPLDTPLQTPLERPMQASRSERRTSRDDFDQTYRQRSERLLSVPAGSTSLTERRREPDREQQRERQREQRLEQRRNERQSERQQMMMRERAQQRRAQRPQLSTD